MIAAIRNHRTFTRFCAAVVVTAFMSGIASPALAVASQIPSAGAGEVPRSVVPMDDIRARVKRASDKLIGQAQLSSTVAAEVDSLLLGVRDEIIAQMDSELSRFRGSEMSARVESRTAKARASLEAKFAGLSGRLKAVSAKRASEQGAELAALKDELSQLMGGRPHSAVNPDQLPIDVPARITKEPRRTKEQYAASGVQDIAEQPIRLASTSLAGLDLTPPSSSAYQGYIAESSDVVFTDDIQALASTLGGDARTIYYWVRNEIRFQPTYGSLQGAQGTLASRRGNAIDTASLLIALLRTSNIPARYVHGTVQVSAAEAQQVLGVSTPLAAMDVLGKASIPVRGLQAGGVVHLLEFEHVWVEAWVPYEPSLGAKPSGQARWIALDPSFKRLDVLEPMDVEALTGVDPALLTSTLLDGASVSADGRMVTNLNLQGFGELIETAGPSLIGNALTSNPNVSVGDLTGTARTVQMNEAELPTGLPYKVIATGARYDALPNELRFLFSYELSDEFGRSLIRWTKPTSEFVDKRLDLYFRPATVEDAQILEKYVKSALTGPMTFESLAPVIPAYLIDVVPLLAVGAAVVVEGQPVSFGAELRTRKGYWTPIRGWHYSAKKIVAGEYHAIGLDLVGTSKSGVLRYQASMEATRDGLLAGRGDAVSSQSLVGDTLQLGLSSYFMMQRRMMEMSASSQGLVAYRLPSFGSFMTTLSPAYLGGVPIEARYMGMQVDIDHLSLTVVSRTGDKRTEAQFLFSHGPLASALEHAIPEYLLSSTNEQVIGVSAVRAITMAIRGGQTVYQIDRSNIDTVLPQISVDAAIRADIIASVQAGRIAVTHANAVQVAGEAVHGYIILNPESGAGAYKIGGGLDGGRAIMGGFAAMAITALLAAFVLEGILAFLAVLAVFFAAWRFAEKIAEIANADLPERQEVKEIQKAAFIYPLFAFAGFCMTWAGWTLLPTSTAGYAGPGLILILAELEYAAEELFGATPTPPPSPQP